MSEKAVTEAKGETKSSTAGMDEAINRAKAAAAARKKATAEGVVLPTAATPPGESGTGATAPSTNKKAPASDAEKAASKALKDAERAASKAERDRVRGEIKAQKEAEKANKPANMSKVDKAAARLPELTSGSKLIFNDATTNLTADQVGALALHLQHFNRVKSTEISASASSSFKVGDRVTITRAGDGTNPKLVGATGTCSKVQRIRMYVVLDGDIHNGVNIAEGNRRNDGKGWYFWISDADAIASAGTTTPEITNEITPASEPEEEQIAEKKSA
jgi:hypothetical protein